MYRYEYDIVEHEHRWHAHTWNVDTCIISRLAGLLHNLPGDAHYRGHAAHIAPNSNPNQGIMHAGESYMLQYY